MNIIYAVKWANKKLTSKDINVASVLVQGENLTKKSAKQLAKKQIEEDCGSGVFRKNKLKFFDIIDITEHKPVLDVVYH